MKKCITLLLAFALVIGLSQCKKKVETISSVPASVYITLDVDGGDKVIVDPHGGSNYATVKFEQGDIIYVGNNGAYCGYLEHDGTKFGGNINPTSGDDADFLHFYFMGNKGPKDQQPINVPIYDQTAKYPVISYGRSIQMYNSSTTSYSATLYNKCAIMRFDVTGAVNAGDIVTITGMNNLVTVDFSKNIGTTTGEPYTYSKIGSGDITLHNESNGERWAILLPQNEVTTATASAGGYTHSSTFTVPAVSANGYYGTPVSVAVQSYTPGGFSVDANGTKVRFAPANLQYTKSTGEWSFMGCQWSMKTWNHDVGENYANQDIVCLFGWGTSGYDYGAAAYQPWSTSINAPDYGPTSGNLTGMSDWGVAAANYLGSGWRTLTIEEWRYLFGSSIERAGKHGHGRVGDVNGMIFLPDDWTLPSGLSFTSSNNDFNSNTYTVEQWAAMEANGAVFLPAAGYRLRTPVSNVGSNGCYWSASSFNSRNAWLAGFGDAGYNVTNETSLRYRGYSVRLVRDVN